MKAYSIPALVTGLLVYTSVASPTYFIVGTRPVPFEFGGGWPEHLESQVVAFDDESVVAQARNFIRNSRGNGPWVRMSVAAGSDGINRDYLIPGAPEWNWHPTSNGEFFSGYIVLPILPLSPSAINTPEGMTIIQEQGGIWFYSGGTILAELNPAFSTKATANSKGGIDLEWDYLGPYYAFTVEARSTVSGGDWQPAPGVAWPTREQHWQAPAAATTSPVQFYRVRAEIKKPAPDDPS